MMKNIVKLIVAMFCLIYAEQIIAQDFIKWKVQTDDEVVSTALILDDVVYIGSADSNLYALNATTGELIWKYKAKNPIYSSPAVYNDVLCFESGNILYALNLLGEYQWEKVLYDGQVTETIDSWDYYHSSPFLVDSIAYIASEGGNVYGINLEDSSTVFHVQAPGQHIIRVTPNVFGDIIYFGDWDGVMYAYEISSENMLWDYDTKTDEDYTGWENSIQTAIEIFDSSVYFSGRNCRLYCADALTGDIKWKWEEPSDMWIVGGPVIYDSVIYVGSSNQFVLYTFDAITGEPIYEADLDHRVWGIAWVDNNYVYAGSGSFYALEKETGSIVSRFETPGVVHSSPVISDSIIYVGSTDGYIYAIDQKLFIEHKFSATSFNKETTDIGELSNDDAVQNISVYLRNQGEGADSVIIEFTIPANDVEEALEYTQGEMIVPANDSVEISMSLDPSEISAGDKIFYIGVESTNNLSTDRVRKIMEFSISAPDAVTEVNTLKTGINTVYPNPLSDVTFIEYSLEENAYVLITIVDLNGKEIENLVSEFQSSGKYGITFNAANLSAGEYYCILSVNNTKEIKKLLLVK